MLTEELKIVPEFRVAQMLELQLDHEEARLLLNGGQLAPAKIKELRAKYEQTLSKAAPEEAKEA